MYVRRLQVCVCVCVFNGIYKIRKLVFHQINQKYPMNIPYELFFLFIAEFLSSSW